MPGGDRTGPMGRGPMTGRAAGFCAGNPSPGYIYPGSGRGFGRGRGFGQGFWGRGRGFWHRSYEPEPFYHPVQSKEDEKTYLESIVKDLEEELKQIKNRLQELSKEKKETS